MKKKVVGINNNNANYFLYIYKKDLSINNSTISFISVILKFLKNFKINIYYLLKNNSKSCMIKTVK